MSEPPPIDNLIEFLPRTFREQTIPSPQLTEPDQEGLTVWRALWSVLAVHVRELADQGVIDEAGLTTIAGALDAVLRHRPDSAESLPRLMTGLEQRIDALLPAEFSGVTTLGLAREEWQATAIRMLWRDAGLTVERQFAALREEVISLGDAHAVTLMPASIAGRPAQPTMLGHFLGGVIAPLRTAASRIASALTDLERSPLGAGLLAGEMIAVDRERVAKSLGFTGPIPNTFDAVANVEDFVAVLESLAAGLAPVSRLLREFAAWIRASPNSLVLTETWERRPEPTVPALVLGDRLDSMIDDMNELLRRLAMAVVRLRGIDYAPLGASHSVTFSVATGLINECWQVIEHARDFLANGVLINRAYLGNRAGRGYTTAGDLAAFLMSEEQLPPSAARGIASIVAGKLQEQSLETSAVTQEMIDSAALMLIGREIKVEIETLGRYLAPRRFIERRQVTGSPAAEQLREWLARERNALEKGRPSHRGADALNAIQADIERLASSGNS